MHPRSSSLGTVALLLSGAFLSRRGPGDPAALRAILPRNGQGAVWLLLRSRTVHARDGDR